MSNQRKPTPRYQPTPRRASTARDKASTRNDAQRRRSSTQAAGQRTRTESRRTTRTQRPATRQAPQPKRTGAKGVLPFAIGAAAIVVVVAVIAGFALSSKPETQSEPQSQGAATRLAPAGSVSFVAVGDNLPDDYIGYYADSLAGEPDDDVHDYEPLYAPVSSLIQEADLAYIDQETHLGGNELGARGYPSFNTTDEMADAVVDLGFDFVASATNHSYDWGLHGAVEHSLSVWETKPVAFTGTAVTKEQYDRIATVERNGITFALLNYTYGVNGFEQDELPEYAVNFIDESRIASDVQRAREQADVVLVAMHWGTELLMEADDDQQRLAQFLADLDVDVVLGSHPHVIGPMAWVADSANPDHRTLVAYSLGNFLADHEAPTPEVALEGMLTCDFVRAEAGGDVSIENVRWVPLVCHSDEDRWNFAVYPVNEYPLSLAKQNRALSGIDNPLYWLCETTVNVVGQEWF